MKKDTTGQGGNGNGRHTLFDLEQFRGQVVMITGAGKGTGPGGIGYNTAMAFARAGARLAIIGRTEEKLNRAVADIEAAGAEVISIPGDVSDHASLERLFEATVQRFGRIDILINNAGISGDVRAVVRIKPERFRYTANVHLHTLETTRRAARLMKETGTGGVILNMGTYFTAQSRENARPYPFRTPYTAAQAWKLEQTRAAAWELSKDGIRVMGLSIGPVEGGRIDSIVYPLGAMERSLWGREVEGADIRRKTERMHPSHTFLHQENAARSIMALVSKELRDSANGTVVELAGGLEYKVPPRISPPLLGGRIPDLTGKRVLVAGRPTHDQAATLTLAFAACGARVVLATPTASKILLELSGDRVPEKYSDGQRTLLSRVTTIDMHPDRESEVAALFERLTAPAPVDESEAGTGSAATGTATALDTVIILTGEPGSAGECAAMNPDEQERLKQRFLFEPVELLRHGIGAMLLEGNRRSGMQDGRFLSFGPFMEMLARERGTLSTTGALQRIEGGWTADEEGTLHAGARLACGSVILVGPSLTREEADDAPLIGVLRSGLQAIATSVATETATARARIQVNAMMPGSDCGTADAWKTAHVALQLTRDSRDTISGMVYYPDERNAAIHDPGPMAGRTAVVTGGGRNIGQEIALKLARQGASVVVAGRGEPDLSLTARAIRALGGKAGYVTADIAFPGERERILEEARRVDSGGPGLEGVAIWVNNAGIGGTFSTLAEIELDGDARWHQTLAINFTGAWLGMVRAILDMRRRGAKGGIVNVSTYYADQPYVFRIPYTVPKILLKACTALLADPLRPHGIFVTDVQPSLIDGPRFRWVVKNYAEHFRKYGVKDPDSDPDIQEWFRQQVPEKAPTAVDVADAVYFAARRGLTGSGRFFPVSTLPVQLPEPQNGRPLAARSGGTVLIVGTARSPEEIERTESLASWALQSGARRVVLAADDGMLARLKPRLEKRGAEKLALTLPNLPGGQVVEVQSVETTSPAAIADLFEGLGEVDTVLYAPGAPEESERFMAFPSDPALTGLDEAAIETRYVEHQKALSHFLDRQVTGALLVAREAARRAVPRGRLIMFDGRDRSPEGILATEAMRQIVRIAAAEFHLVGKGLHTTYTHRIPELPAIRPVVVTTAATADRPAVDGGKGNPADAVIGEAAEAAKGKPARAARGGRKKAAPDSDAESGERRPATGLKAAPANQ